MKWKGPERETVVAKFEAVLVFAWMDWGKSWTVQTGEVVSRSRLEWGNHRREVNNVHVYSCANNSGENMKSVFTRDEMAYTVNANWRVKNTFHLKTHLDLVLRAIAARYYSENTFHYFSMLRGNYITMREKIFWHRRMVGKPYVW
jgi:hypothetical protein